MGSCLSSESRTHLSDSPTTPLGSRRKKGLRRKLSSRNPSFDYRREEQLHRIPGRMFVNGSSEVASIFTQQGRKGTNQDAMIVWENFGARTDTIFCGVFDGHGPYGHMVAKRVRDSLPLKLSSHWEVKIGSTDVSNLNSMGSTNSEAACLLSTDEVPNVLVDLEDTLGQTQFFQTSKEAFLKAFKVMDKELKVYGNIDCFCSGTTAVTLVKQGQDLVIGNVGDSRAVLGTKDDDGRLVPVQLTVDLKPNLPAEMERIRRCKGRVFSLRDEPEVARVWLPYSDSPGLAMARAFGDFCLKDFGLISVPDISYRRLSEKDEFIVLATDGIWDVLSNEEVVNIVASSPTRASASRNLVESAVRGWKRKYPTSKVDDCAVVCLFLDEDSNDMSTASAVISNAKNTSTGYQEVANGNENVTSSPSRLSPDGTIPYGTVPDGNAEESFGEGKEEGKEAIAINKEASEYEEANMGVEIDWSALEGVSRVNTMVTLPRYVPEKDKKGTGNKKT